MIEINDITVRIGSKVLLEHASAHISDGQKVGLVGANGCGKSTLFRVLKGELETETGSVFFPNSYRVVFVEQEMRDIDVPILDFLLSTDRERTELLQRLETASGDELAEIHERLNMIEAASAPARAAGILHGLGFKNEDLSRPIREFSGGWRMRLALAAALFQPSEVLLLDEPTNHLDERARAGIAAYLRSKNGFILVSHDRAFLDGCVDHILAINRTRIDLQQGNFSSWYENKQREDRQEIERNERLQADIRRLSAAARRTAGWSEQAEKSKTGSRNSGLRPDRGYIGHKAAKMMKRSKAIEQRRQEAAEEKAGLLHNIEIAEALKLPVLRSPAETLCALEEVTLFYGGRQIGGEIRFDVRRGERVALTGRNGCGKSSVLKLLLGEEIHHTGRVYRTPRLEISYVPQDASRLCGPLDAFIAENRLDGPLFRAILRKLDFERVQFGKDMADYSAGQKKKVLLAKSLCEPAHLYIWDEPLNYIDIFSRMQIEQLLLEYRPTLLFVEHDSRFRDTVATKTVDLV